MKHFHLELRADFVLPVHIESVRILVPFILLHAAFYWLQMPELWGGGGSQGLCVLPGSCSNTVFLRSCACDERKEPLLTNTLLSTELNHFPALCLFLCSSNCLDF